MKNALKQFGFVVLMTAIALITLPLTGCDDSPKVDTALNGTWLYNGETVKFNNGSFESPEAIKGTYTADNGNYTMTMTHIHGDFLSAQSKWFTKPEVKTLIKTYYSSYTDAQIDQVIDSMVESIFGIPVSGSTADVFTKLSGTYSINGNTLTMTTSAGSMTMTRN